MNGITTPISFANTAMLNEFYFKLNQKAIAICVKYSVPELWENAIIYKDENKKELSIFSWGMHITAGSNQEKAEAEILKAFNEFWNI